MYLPIIKYPSVENQVFCVCFEKLCLKKISNFHCKMFSGSSNGYCCQKRDLYNLAGKTFT
jgi:hypothetical protein